MIRVFIVDDEALARVRLKDLLQEIADVEIIGEASNGSDALTQIERLEPDVVLLDIRMPVMDGLETARHLADWPDAPAVIFTTAHDEHALAAFEANAIDYLLKPVRRERLEQALRKAQRPAAQTAVLEQAREGEARSHICAHQRGNLVLIPVTDIFYFQSDSKYTTVHHRSGTVLIDEPLKQLEQEFAAHFTRIHRNALVANHEISALEKDSNGHLQLRLRHSDVVLEVSRRLAPEVRRVLNEMRG